MEQDTLDNVELSVGRNSNAASTVLSSVNLVPAVDHVLDLGYVQSSTSLTPISEPLQVKHLIENQDNSLVQPESEINVTNERATLEQSESEGQSKSYLDTTSITNNTLNEEEEFVSSANEQTQQSVNGSVFTNTRTSVTNDTCIFSPDHSKSTHREENFTEIHSPNILNSSHASSQSGLPNTVRNITSKQRTVRLTKRVITKCVLARPRISSMDPEEIQRCFESGDYDVIEESEPVISTEVSTLTSSDQYGSLNQDEDHQTNVTTSSSATSTTIPVTTISLDDEDKCLEETPVTDTTYDNEKPPEEPQMEASPIVEQSSASDQRDIEQKIRMNEDPNILMEHIHEADESEPCHSEDYDSRKEESSATDGQVCTEMDPNQKDCENSERKTSTEGSLATASASIKDQFNQIAKVNKGLLRIRKPKEAVYTRYKTQPVTIRYSPMSGTSTTNKPLSPEVTSSFHDHNFKSDSNAQDIPGLTENRKLARLSPSPKPQEDVFMLRKAPYSSLDRRFRYLNRSLGQGGSAGEPHSPPTSEQVSITSGEFQEGSSKHSSPSDTPLCHRDGSRILQDSSSSHPSPTNSSHSRFHSDELVPMEGLSSSTNVIHVSDALKRMNMQSSMSSQEQSRRISDTTGTQDLGHHEEHHETAISNDPHLHRSSVSRSRSAASTLPLLRQRKLAANAQAIQQKNKLANSDEHMNVPPIMIKSTAVEKMSSDNLPDLDAADEELRRLLVKRSHIINELLDVEGEYVKTLDLLVNVYKVQLKQEEILESNQVDTIFYKIHEILIYHANFLSQLSGWSKSNTVGNLFTSMFTKAAVIDCYTAFIANFTLSEKMLEHCLSTKSAFVKFCEAKQRESRTKLPLKALVVQPVQRIPRYELLIKRLIEYTPTDFDDYLYLLEAEKIVHDLAVKINAMKEASQDESLTEGLKLLERLQVPGTTSSTRQYIRHDMIQLDDRKEPVCMFSFSDQIIFTLMKRRPNQSAKKPGYLRLPCSSGIDIVDNVKYKVFHRINMENIELDAECLDTAVMTTKQRLKHDLAVLEQMKQYASQLTKCHEELAEEIQRLTKQIESEYDEIPKHGFSKKISITVTTKEGIEKHTLRFVSSDRGTIWEKAITELKNQLVTIPRTLEFYQYLQVTKIRTGLQFTCAAPIEGYNAKNERDIWLCQSDGCSSHVCLLSMQPEPIVTLNTPLSGCNSLITCICAVPGWMGGKGSLSRAGSDKRRSAPDGSFRERGSIKTSPVRIESLGDSRSGDSGLIDTRSSGITTESPSNNAASSEIFNFSSSESDSEERDCCLTVPTSLIREAASVEELLDNNTGASQEKRFELHPATSDEINIYTPPRKRRLMDPYKATMWLGSEEGIIFIFYSSDNVKTTRNKQKVQLNGPILNILFHDGRVFVSLGNGELVMYHRDTDGLWDMESGTVYDIGNHKIPVKSMLTVTGSIWGSCRGNIVSFSPKTLKQERIFAVGSSFSERYVHLMACSGLSVWISLDGSPTLYLYHATTFELLSEVDIRPSVCMRLQGCEEIITRHKEACLRLTCLLICKDLLLAGTSAGVIVTISTPNVTTNTTRGMIKTPHVSSLERGHTGHVRFLVSLESPTCGPNGSPSNATSKGQHLLSSKQTSVCNVASKTAPPSSLNSPIPGNSITQSTSSTLPNVSSPFSLSSIITPHLHSSSHHGPRRMSLSPYTTMDTQMRVISGGDGYENFEHQRQLASGGCALSPTELADLGKDDSVNHLIIWDIP